MIKNITPNQKDEKITKQLQPKETTIQTILAFAAAYRVEKLVNGDILQFVMN